jgi:hypothetical protein
MVGKYLLENGFKSDLSKYAVFYQSFSCDLYCSMVRFVFILHYVGNNEMVLYLVVKSRIVLYLYVIVPVLLLGNLQNVLTKMCV